MSHSQTIAIVGTPNGHALHGDSAARTAPCATVAELRSLAGSSQIGAVVYVSDGEAASSAESIALLMLELMPLTPVLLRMRLTPPCVRDLLSFVRVGLDARASIVDTGNFDQDIKTLSRSLLARSASADLLTAILPIVPPRCRIFATAGLLVGAKRTTVGHLKQIFSVSERLLRMRFEEIGMPAHEMLGRSLACHGLRLGESGQYNVNEAALLLGFEQSDGYSARVYRYAGHRPIELQRITTSLDLIAAFRSAIIAGQKPR